MLIDDGVYFDNGDKNYELATCYYLSFHIKSSFFSVEQLECTEKEWMQSTFRNKAEFYHFYTDHLLFSMGQISEIFHVVNNSRSKKRDYNDRREENRTNFRFSESEFPILSNKAYRNTIEHIDEYNINTINEYGGVGGFNFIDDTVDSKLCEELLSDEHRNIYILDMISKRIYITRNDKRIYFYLDELNDELKKLEKFVDDFRSIISK